VIKKRATITSKLFVLQHNKPQVKALQNHDLIEKDLAKPENYSLLTKMGTIVALTGEKAAPYWRLAKLLQQLFDTQTNLNLGNLCARKLTQQYC
jgi:hypothetical protein